MADNYLENRYREIFGNQGGPARKGGASLDMIMRKSAEQGTADPAYKVHPLQIVAIDRCIKLAFGDIETATECSEGTARIEVEVADGFTAGRICQTALLKAAEMGLHARFGYEGEKLIIRISGLSR